VRLNRAGLLLFRHPKRFLIALARRRPLMRGSSEDPGAWIMAAAGMGKALRQVEDLLVEGRLASLPDGELLERFLGVRDEAAFAALVERHGPMVLGTCRALLRDAAAAEDVFQATFLVLVCKARSIRGQSALASWLYQVAHRIAIQAGTEAARRRRQRLAGELRATACDRAEPDDEWREILHDELARLSDKHRLPILLCDLEGKTHAQAAAELNCGEATIRRRLAGARELLRSRLTRRGVALTVGTLATSLGRPALAKVPPGWAEATIKAATAMSSTATRIAVGDVVSTTAAALARRSLHAMLWGQLRTAGALVIFLVALVGIAWGVGTYRQDRETALEMKRMQRPPSAPAARVAPPEAGKQADPAESVAYRGRVLDVEGHPIPGAALYVNPREFQHPYHSPVRATSGPDGQFRFAVPKTEFDTFHWDAPWRGTRVLAGADGYAVGLADYRDDGEELTLRLPRDDVPISGRIVDLQGRPVADVTVAVLEVECPAGGSLDGWLKAVEHPKDSQPPLYKFLPVSLSCRTDPPFIEAATTGADGRFRISSIGRERVATLAIEGPTIETVHVQVRTRPGATIRVPTHLNRPDEGMRTIYGATFEHVAGPTRPIEGVVRDIDTRAPLAGIMVHGERELGSAGGPDWWYVKSITDAQGHYRLVGLPRDREGIVQAVAPLDYPRRGVFDRGNPPQGPRDEDLPYLSASIKVGDPVGTGSIKLDINLKRGVSVTGRVIEADTGKPVRARVEYYVFMDNPHQEAYPAFRGSMRQNVHFVGRDGAFRFVAFPGPSVLVANAIGGDYIQGAGIDALKHGPQDRHLPTYPVEVSPRQYNVVAEIEPAPGTVSMSRDLAVVRGRSLTITVLDPDGKPVSGNEVEILGNDMGYWEKDSLPSTYTIRNWRPGEKRTLRFHNLDRRLTGEIVLQGDGPQPRSITLQPWGVLTGRLVDTDGQPWGLEGELDLHPLGQYTKVDKDGRFRAEGLTPGKTYNILLRRTGSIFDGFGLEAVTVGPGETKDLGDIVPRSPR
jgi:RNA polymerase sigma factor (sigma-70 family)